ncbi:MAG TPA: VOC family protein [Solirubrobacteraceae bacterium]
MTAARLTHLAINAGDVAATRRFYGAVFGWTSSPHGPPGFFRFYGEAGEDPGALVALQERRELVAGSPATGPECTFAVDDLAAVAEAVRAGGGKVVMEPTPIPGVGELLFFADPDGNVVGAIQYG